MSACAGKGEGRSWRMLAALKWRARHFLPPARAPRPGQRPAGLLPLPGPSAHTGTASSGQAVLPVSLQTPGEDTSAVQLPGASSQLGAQPGAAAAGRSCAMARAGPAAHRAFATARMFLFISVFAQSGLLAGAAPQSSSSLLRIPDCVSEYLLKCFPQYREDI